MKSFKHILKTIPELELDDSQKKILAGYGAGLLAVLIVFFFLFLKPSAAALFKIISESGHLKSEIRTLEHDLEFEDKLKAKIDKITRDIEAYETSFTREKELPDLLENLSDLAQRSRVKILAINPIDVKAAGKEDQIYQAVPIAITAQSGFHDLGIFINKLEQGERYMQVKDIEIKANPQNAKRHNVEFVVHAFTIRGDNE